MDKSSRFSMDSPHRRYEEHPQSPQYHSDDRNTFAEEYHRLLPATEAPLAARRATLLRFPSSHSDNDNSRLDSDDVLPSWNTRALKNRRGWSRTSKLIIFLAAVTMAGWVYVSQKEARLNTAWIPDEDTIQFSKSPLPYPLEQTSILNYTLPLRTRGRNIVDAMGKRFKLLSVNWYGASDELFVPGGLDIRHRSEIAKTIRRTGFNSVRLPYADELVTSNPVIEPHLVMANPDLAGLRALDVFEAVVTALTDAGLAVIVNNHITKATWCCGINPCDASWANDYLGGFCTIRQTEEDWIRNWEHVMGRFQYNRLVIGVDLRNEVRGLWGTMPWAKWAAAAEACGKRLQKMNQDWLIVVEGTESANDLSGARARPITLNIADKLVYSAHVYAWSGWGSWGGRFSQRSYDSFVDTMRYHWLYLLEEDIAPVWIGEMGAPRNPSVGGVRYWENLRRLLKRVDADFGYWAINPSQPHNNVTESYSLLERDWVTPVLDYRMKDIVELMQQVS